MARYKPHFKSNKQLQKTSQKINQLVQNGDYQNLINTLCPRYDQADCIDELLPSLSNDQKYALGLAFYKLQQPRKALTLWAGLQKKRGEDFDHQLKNLATTLLGQWDAGQQNRAGASSQAPWSPSEVRGLYNVTKNLNPTHPSFPVLKDLFLKTLWNQGQTLLIDDNLLKPVENPPLTEISKILGQSDAGDLGTLINQTQCQFWTRRNGTLEAKFIFLNQYLSVAASLVHNQNPGVFTKHILPYVESFFEWYGPTLGSHLASLRSLALIQVKILDQVSQYLHSGESAYVLKNSILWSPGSYVRQSLEDQNDSESLYRALPSHLAFFYTEVGFSILVNQTGCDRSLTKIDQDKLMSTSFLENLMKSGNTYGFLCGLVLLAQKQGSLAHDFLIALEEKGALEWCQEELERYLSETLDHNEFWIRNGDLLSIWLYLVKSCPNVSSSTGIEDIFSRRIFSFLENRIENKNLCLHCLHQFLKYLPQERTNALLTTFILALEESVEFIEEIREKGYGIATPRGLLRKVKIKPKDYFAKLVNAYLNTSPIVGFWQDRTRRYFISSLETYFDSLKLSDEMTEKLNMVFMEPYDITHDGLEEFRIALEKVAPSLGCSMELTKLLAIGKRQYSEAKATKSQEVVSKQNSHFLTNPYRILGFESQPTKQQVMAAVLQQMKKNPQNLITIRLAQSSLFDALSGPVFSFLYCFYRGPSNPVTIAPAPKENPVTRSLDVTETTGGVG